MSGNKVFIHIGLPKTATTSLQTDFFPMISDGLFRYIGVFQPRDTKQNNLYQHVSNAVNKRENIEEVRLKLKAEIDSNFSLIISEEMFTVSSSQFSWRDKLDNLQNLICDINYEIIITVREPAFAMFSFYVELYPRFNNRWNNFIDCALHDEDMEIYHYGKLLKKLSENFDSGNIHFYKFEDIIFNKIKRLEKLLQNNSEKILQIPLSHYNSRQKKSDFFVYSRHSVSLIDSAYMHFSWFRKNNSKPVIIIKKLLNPVVKNIDKFMQMKVRVPRPSEEDICLLRKELVNETKALEVGFQIKYD